MAAPTTREGGRNARHRSADGQGRRRTVIYGAFASQAGETVAHLANATWAPDEYEYEHLELPSTPASPTRARRWALGALAGSRLSVAEQDDVTLVISELVTNAVRHARPASVATVVVRLAASADRIRIEVSDRGAGFSPAAIARPSGKEPGGRGLLVVDAIASRWGTACADRHCVWLECDR
jgi:anti-sigma regulatory factor (Ser/Thr protein kinase)